MQRLEDRPGEPSSALVLHAVARAQLAQLRQNRLAREDAPRLLALAGHFKFKPLGPDLDVALELGPQGVESAALRLAGIQRLIALERGIMAL